MAIVISLLHHYMIDEAATHCLLILLFYYFYIYCPTHFQPPPRAGVLHFLTGSKYFSQWLTLWAIHLYSKYYTPIKEQFTHVYLVLEQSQDTKEYSYSGGIPTGRTFIRLFLILHAEHTRFKREERSLASSFFCIEYGNTIYGTFIRSLVWKRWCL